MAKVRQGRRAVKKQLSILMLGLGWAVVRLLVGEATHGAEIAKGLASSSLVPAFVDQYCAGCHNSDKKKGELDLESICLDDVTRHPEIWEKVVRKLRTRQMPPIDKKRPDEAIYKAVLAPVEKALDRAAAEHPNPGRTETFRRLNRSEYQNAIRDLLALDID